MQQRGMVRVRGGIRRITGMPFWNPLRSAAWLLAALAS